jgi:acyl carrier protein
MLVMPETTAARVASTIAKAQHIDVVTVTAEKTLAELGFDSLDGLRLIFELEEEFDIVIPDDQAKSYTTVGRIIEGVTMLLERKTAAPADT